MTQNQDTNPESGDNGQDSTNTEYQDAGEQKEEQDSTLTQQANESAKEQKSESIVKSVLAGYAIADDQDSYLDEAVDKHGKWAVDEAVSKLFKGKFKTYDEAKQYAGASENEQKTYDNLLENPLIKKVVEFAEKAEKNSEQANIAAFSAKCGMSTAEFKEKYYDSPLFQSIFNSVVQSGHDMESAMHLSMKALAPEKVMEQQKEDGNAGNYTASPSGGSVQNLINNQGQVKPPSDGMRELMQGMNVSEEDWNKYSGKPFKSESAKSILDSTSK